MKTAFTIQSVWLLRLFVLASAIINWYRSSLHVLRIAGPQGNTPNK